MGKILKNFVVSLVSTLELAQQFELEYETFDVTSVLIRELDIVNNS